MTTFKSLAHNFCIILGFIFLTSCGGGGVSELANGIGGTGIARITAFGSVYVNGIHYNTDTAEFYFNDKVAQQSDLRLGNIVRVEGKVKPNEKTGIAEKITYSETLTGPITQKAEGKTIVIMNQYVLTDDLTMLHGFKELADLDVDNIVGVSGFRSADGTVKASSIRWISETYDSTELRIEGFINISDGNEGSLPTSIEGLNIGNYPDSLQITSKPSNTENELQNFDFVVIDPVSRPYVAITSTENIQDGTLKASKVRRLDQESFPESELFEIEGFVTSIASSGEFSVGGLPMIATDQTVISQLTDDTYVHVKGKSNTQGQLVAETVTINADNKDVVVKTTLQSVDEEALSIELLGQVAYINDSTIISDSRGGNNSALSLASFANNESTLVVIRKDNSQRLTVVRLSKIEELTDTMFISGLPEAVNNEEGTLALFGQTILAESSTEYLDANQNSLSKPVFFSRASDLQTKILVTGQIRADGIIGATRLELSDLN